MSRRGGTAYVIKGEPSATDAARLHRALTEQQKTDLRTHLRHALKGRAAVLNPPKDADA